MRRFAISPPVTPSRSASTNNAVISPNGKHIAYTTPTTPETEGKLWIQDLDRQEPRAIEGTGGARGPFWSPDSEFIGFATGREIQIKKISVHGGQAIQLCKAPAPGPPRSFPGGYLPFPIAAWQFFGGAWSIADDSIIFSAGVPGRLYQVSVGGGTPEPLFEIEKSERLDLLHAPHFLPQSAGKRILLFLRFRNERPEIILHDLETKRQVVLMDGLYMAYSPTGHILYQQWGPGGSGIWALPFSLETLEPTGRPFQISSTGWTPSVARDGTLVYFEGVRGHKQLVWRDRAGKKLREIGRPHFQISQVALSPDGATVAVGGQDTVNQDVWLHSSLSSDSTRLTFDPIIEGVPVWSPREDKIAFLRGRGIMVANVPKRNLGVEAGSNGGDEATVLVDAAGLNIPNDWSRDGRYFVYSRTPAYNTEAVRTQRDLWYLKCEDEATGCEEVPFLQTPSDESLGQLSPDGRLIAYCSDESGRKEVYVRRFPQGADKWQVSFNGGAQPRWSRDGQELFYVEKNALIAVSVLSRWRRTR